LDSLLQLALEDLVQQYRPHTVIAYGSRVRNRATDSSDIDLACYCDITEGIKDARLFHGVYLDAWIYPTSSMDNIDEGDLRFEDGCLLLDQRGLGEKFLQRVRDKLHQGPKPQSQSDIQHTTEWIHKMLLRAANNDLDGQYRKVWLQFQLLEIYFQLRGKWFLGHKKSFEYLRKNDLKVFDLFEQVYADKMDFDKLHKLASAVVNLNHQS
jgi:predicted nucleotidyltransferase